MILLDTSVIGEVMRPRPLAHVVAWLQALDPATAYVSAVSLAELRLGIALLAPGRRRDTLDEMLERYVTLGFAFRVLAFDHACAAPYASIVAQRREAGRPIAQFDAQIAAIAHVHDMAVATRNVGDFDDCGIELINPFADLVAGG